VFCLDVKKLGWFSVLVSSGDFAVKHLLVISACCVCPFAPAFNRVMQTKRM
jgi:hypothetical protein